MPRRKKAVAAYTSLWMVLARDFRSPFELLQASLDKRGAQLLSFGEE